MSVGIHYWRWRLLLTWLLSRVTANPGESRLHGVEMVLVDVDQWIVRYRLRGGPWKMGPPLHHSQDAVLNRDHAVPVLPTAAVRESDRQRLDFAIRAAYRAVPWSG